MDWFDGSISPAATQLIRADSIDDVKAIPVPSTVNGEMGC